jgi:sperm-associated antigen 16 protein
MSRANARL